MCLCFCMHAPMHTCASLGLCMSASCISHCLYLHLCTFVIHHLLHAFMCFSVDALLHGFLVCVSLCADLQCLSVCLCICAGTGLHIRVCVWPPLQACLGDGFSVCVSTSHKSFPFPYCPPSSVDGGRLSIFKPEENDWLGQ